MDAKSRLDSSRVITRAGLRSPGKSTAVLGAILVLVVPSQCAPLADRAAYLLGPEDQIRVAVSDAKELDMPLARIDGAGKIHLPYAGNIHAAGLTCSDLASKISEELKAVIHAPEVSVEVVEYASQPISILGSVNKPGVHQVRGRKTLFEALSLAEGLRPDAGHRIRITRARDYGPLPVPDAIQTGEFSVAEINVKSLLESQDPSLNILIRPHDTIAVPKAEMVYVVGAVRRPGGFVLAERESMSVLQALSLAEGLDRAANAAGAKILRSTPSGSQRVEAPVNIKRILSGKQQDEQLQSNDILFVPNSASRSVALRSLEAGVQMATGIVVWRR